MEAIVRSYTKKAFRRKKNTSISSKNETNPKNKPVYDKLLENRNTLKPTLHKMSNSRKKRSWYIFWFLNIYELLMLYFSILRYKAARDKPSSSADLLMLY